VAQEVDHLLCKCEALSLNSRPTKTKNRRKILLLFSKFGRIYSKVKKHSLCAGRLEETQEFFKAELFGSTGVCTLGLLLA
jgi:hypothetical protein